MFYCLINYNKSFFFENKSETNKSVYPILEASSFAFILSTFALAACALGPTIPPPHRFLNSS